MVLLAPLVSYYTQSMNTNYDIFVPYGLGTIRIPASMAENTTVKS